MLKLMKLIPHSWINYAFTAVTSYCYIDVLDFLLPYTDLQIIDLKTKLSIFVVVVTSVYWITRAFIYFCYDIPHKKEVRKKEQSILDMKHKLEITKLQRQFNEQDHQIFLNNNE